jgi:hypothetical protein
MSMFRNVVLAAIYVAVLVCLTATSAWAVDYGTAEEAKAMLERAVAAVKDKKVVRPTSVIGGKADMGRTCQYVR